MIENNDISISFLGYFHKTKTVNSFGAMEQNKALTVLYNLFNKQENFNQIKDRYSNINQYFKYSSNDLNKNIPLIIKTLFDKIKNQNASFKSQSKFLSSIDSTGTSIKLSHEIIEDITNMLILLLSSFMNTRNYQKKILDLLEGNTKLIELMSKNYEKEIKMIESLDSIKEIRFFIADDEQINIDVDKIYLFYLFYKIIFPSVLVININLNITKLNQKYSTKESGLKAVYSMNVDEIKNISSEYINCFMANYLLIKTICENCSSVQFTYSQIDDYIIEIDKVFSTFGLNITDKYDLNLMFYNSFFNIPKLLKFSININSLDNLLFKNFLVLFFSFLSKKTMLIEELEINLFPKEIHSYGINFRKILLNKIFFEKLTQKDFEDYKEDIINWKYEKVFRLNTKKENKPSISIKDDKILDLLYDDFSENLLILILLLEKNIKNNKLKLSLIMPKFLLDKKNYSSGIYFFIHNLFKILEKKSGLIKLNLLKLESNILVPEIIPNNIDLHKCSIQNFEIKIGNLSKIIDLNLLPYQSLESIKLSNIFYEDIRDLTNGINQVNEKRGEIKLKLLKLKLNYQAYIDYDIIYKLFNIGYCTSIENCFLKFKNEFCKDDIIKLIIKILNGCATSENTGLKSKVHIKLFYDVNDKLYFKEIFEQSLKAFDITQLNGNIFVTHHIKKMKIKREQGKKRCIKYEIIKLYSEKKTELYMKLILRKIIGNNSNKLQIGTRIMSFLIPFTSKMEVSFHLKNE